MILNKNRDILLSTTKRYLFQKFPPIPYPKNKNPSIAHAMNLSTKICPSLKTLLIFAVLAVLPTVGNAHILPTDHSSFYSGFRHPLHGWDHLLTTIAIGLWVVQIGRQATRWVPCIFIGIMVLGAGLGLAGIKVPWVEEGITTSLLILGVLIAIAVRLPLWISIILVGTFAIFHGHAHGTEMPNTFSSTAYMIGFVTGTILLLIGGMGMGVLMRTLKRVQLIRWAGIAIVINGIYLLLTGTL